MVGDAITLQRIKAAAAIKIFLVMMVSPQKVPIKSSLSDNLSDERVDLQH